MPLTWFALLMIAPFFWFSMLARRTFVVPGGGAAGLALGAVSMISGIALGVWAGERATYHPILWAGGAIVAVSSVVLYESARRVVTGRGFCSVLSGEVPPAVCTEGPFRHVRHPVYTSYLLAFLGLLVAYPGVESASIFVLNVGFYLYAASHEERAIARSPLGSAYASYKRVTGMFLPRLRHAIGSPPPSA